jgi:hypothetical protein
MEHVCSVDAEATPLSAGTILTGNAFDGGPAQGCVSIELNLSDMGSDRVLDGAALVKNRCNSPVAILTAPIETRVRLRAAHRFPLEEMRHAVYAKLYVFSAAAGPRDMFIGDGGERVLGHPDFRLLPARSEQRIRVTGTNPQLASLPRGQYGALLITYGAPAKATAARTGAFRVECSVEEHNSRQRALRQVYLSRDASPIASLSAAFEVIE